MEIVRTGRVWKFGDRISTDLMMPGHRVLANPDLSIEEAAKFATLDQLAISPQCVFSSTVPGNDVTVDDQIAKLRLVMDVAGEVWG